MGICIHVINVSPKPIFFNAVIKKRWLTESNAFWIATVTTNPVKFKKSVTCKISEKSHPPSFINLSSTWAVWFDEIKKGNYFLMRSASALERIFKSTFN